MKWTPSFTFPSPQFRGGIVSRWEMKGTLPYQVQLPSSSSPLTSSLLLRFQSFSFCYSFSWAHLEAEDWGKTKCWLSLSDQGSRYPLLHSGLAAGEQMDPSNQGDKRSRQGEGVNPGVSGSSPALGKSKGNNGKSFFPSAEFTCATGTPIILKWFCTVVIRI